MSGPARTPNEIKAKRGTLKPSRAVWGMEVGHLMNIKHAKYIKAGLFTWQQGFGILHVDGKNVTPQIVPIIKNSFTVEGKTWRW